MCCRIRYGYLLSGIAVHAHSNCSPQPQEHHMAADSVGVPSHRRLSADGTLLTIIIFNA